MDGNVSTNLVQAVQCVIYEFYSSERRIFTWPMCGQSDARFVWIKGRREGAKTIRLKALIWIGLGRDKVYFWLTVCASNTLSSQLPPGKRFLSHCVAWSKFSHMSLLTGVTASVILNISVCRPSMFLLQIGGSTRIIFANGILLGGLKNDVARVLWYYNVSRMPDQRLMSTHFRTPQLTLPNVHKAQPGVTWGPICQGDPIWIVLQRLRHSPRSLWDTDKL